MVTAPAHPDGSSVRRPLRSKSTRGARSYGYRYGVIAVWALEIVIFSVLAPGSFLSWANFASIFSSQAGLLVLALALVPTLAANEIDLSAAGTMTITATLVGQLNAVLGWNIWLAVVAGLAVALAVGLVNGYLAVRVGVQSIVVTLGMGTLLVGLALWASNSLTIGGVSLELGRIMNTPVLGVSTAFYYAVIIGLALWYVYKHTAIGRHIVFIGQNREVARLAGISVSRLRMGAFVTTSVLSGVAGVIVIGVAGGLQPSSLQTLLLPAFAAAFLSSAIFEPGRINPLGTIVALLFLATGITGLVLLGLDSWIRDVFYGAAVVVAVTVSRVAFVRAQKRNNT
ncbi:ABC transporter permease [uncultured Amnibacterium sp.]|uniref:ABC transporter permease n=1 Tax=uncultured Amnibacterium sp. TaxID=1631851 RepID=UPI0035CC21B2